MIVMGASQGTLFDLDTGPLNPIEKDGARKDFLVDPDIRRLRDFVPSAGDRFIVIIVRGAVPGDCEGYLNVSLSLAPFVGTLRRVHRPEVPATLVGALDVILEETYGERLGQHFRAS